LDVGSDPTADQAAIVVFLAPVGLIVGAFYGPFVAFAPEVVERDERLLRGILEQAGSGLASRVEGLLDTAIPGRVCREGGDALLSIELVSVDLTGPFLLDPLDRPALRVRTRLTRSADGKKLYAAELSHSGHARAFSRWASSPEDLQQYLDRALQDISEKIIDELFLTLPPPEVQEPK
jgi:hypothetical protein